VLDKMPAPPKVLNLTHGGMSDADAAALAIALYRQSAFIGWMEASVQPKFNDHLRDTGEFNTPVGEASRRGEVVVNPPCDLYPVKVAVVPVDQAILDFQTSLGYRVTSAFAVVEQYQGPCAITAQTPNGPRIVGSFGDPNPPVIETGQVRSDPILGPLYYSESKNVCPPGASGGPAACRVLG